MPYVLFHLGLFDGSNRSDSEDTILWLLEVLTDRNCRYLIAHPETQKLYDSGVEYALPEQMEDCKIDPSQMTECVRFLRKIKASEDSIQAIVAFLHGIEVFRDIPTVLAKRRVDCDNLATFRCAELRHAGIKATPFIIWRDTEHGTTYHALVRHPDGTSEDPSILLGMGGEQKAADREEERRKNKERHDTFVKAARILCANGDMDTLEAARQINALGFLPSAGTW